MNRNRSALHVATLAILLGSLPLEPRPRCPEWMREMESEPQSEDARKGALRMAQEKRDRRRRRNLQCKKTKEGS